MNGITEYPELVNLLKSALVDEPPSHIRDGNVIAPGYDQALDELRDYANQSQRILDDLLRNEQEKTGLSSLKMGYNKISGYYFELSKMQAEKAPEYFIRRQTLKNVERFTIPELKGFEQKALSAQAKAIALEKKCFEELLVKIAQDCHRLQKSSSDIACLDCLVSLALFAMGGDFCVPVFTSQRGIEIKEGKHPLLIEDKKSLFVANDTALSDQQHVHIITGPNMGGKSTYMRQCATLVLLAHIGCLIPAKSMQLSIVDKIYCRVGSGDDMAGGRSTFMLEMTETANILHNATKNSLVLMDEVGRGTSTYDGMALAWSIVDYLVKKNQSMVLFATHYYEITQLQAVHSQVVNLHLQAKESQGKLIFLYKLALGATSKSYGLQVARLAGVPAQCLSLAKEKLKAFNQNDVSSIQGDFLQHDLAEEDESSWKEKFDAITSRIDAIDIDSLSPRKALDTLYLLAQEAQELETQEN